MRKNHQVARRGRGTGIIISAAAGRRVRRPFYGWLIVVVGALVAFSSGPGQSFVFSVFLDSIIEDTNLSRTTISALYAVGTGVSAIMVGLVSRLADRHGPRIVLVIVVSLLGLACFGMAFATGVVAFFLAFAALRALGQGSLPINATLLTATWFVARRGRAIAVMGLGFALSNAVLPPLVRYLIDNIGWREAYMVLGVMVWILVIPATLFFVRNTPEEMGLHPDGAPHPPENETPPDPSGVYPRDTRKVFSSLNFWLLALPLATPSLIVTALVFHQTSLFESRGLSAQLAASVFVVMAVASAGSSLFAGFLIDRAGPKRLFAANMALILVGTSMIGIIGSPALAVVYAAIMGAGGGMQQIISGVIWAHIYGRRGLGRIQGSAVMVSITAAAIGPLPLSWFRDFTGGYGAGLAFMAGLAVLAAIGIAFASPAPVSPSSAAGTRSSVPERT